MNNNNFFIQIPIYLFKKIFSECFNELPITRLASDEIKRLDCGDQTLITLHSSRYNLISQIGLVCKEWALNILPRIANIFSLRIINNRTLHTYLRLTTRGLLENSNTPLIFRNVYLDHFNIDLNNNNNNNNNNSQSFDSINLENIYISNCSFNSNHLFSILRNPTLKEIKLNHCILTRNNVDAISKEIVSCTVNRSLHFEMNFFSIKNMSSFNLLKVFSHPNAQLSSLVLVSKKYLDINFSEVLSIFQHSPLQVLHIIGFKVLEENYKSVVVSEQQQQNMDALKELKINHLKMEVKVKEELFTNIISKYFGGVRNLELRGYDFKSKDLTLPLAEYLTRLAPTLTSIDFYLARFADNIDPLVNVVVNKLVNLKTFDISNSNPPLKELVKFFKPSLKSLEFTTYTSDNSIITSLSNRPANQISHLKHLKIAHIFEHIYTFPQGTFNQFLQSNPSLTSLDLTFNSLTSDQFREFFEALDDNHTIVNLGINNLSRAADNLPPIIAALNKNHTLANFELNNYLLNNRSTLELLEVIDKRPSTKYLSVWTGITPLQELTVNDILTFIGNSKKLFSLNLGQDIVNPSSASLLLQSCVQSKNLRVIELSANTVKRKEYIQYINQNNMNGPIEFTLLPDFNEVTFKSIENVDDENSSSSNWWNSRSFRISL